MKKPLALLMILAMMLSLFAACSQPADNDTPSTTPDTSSSEPTSEPTEEPMDEPDSESTDKPDDEPVETPDDSGKIEQVEETTGLYSKTADGYLVARNDTGVFTGLNRNDSGVYSTGGLALPLSEDLVSYSAFILDLNPLYGAPELPEVKAYQVAEERTNVHIDFECHSLFTVAEKFSLSLAGGDYPDTYMYGTFPAGYDNAVDEEIIIDLAEYLPTYAPNYYGLVNANEEMLRVATTDSGYMPYMSGINVGLSLEPTWQGFWVRQDMLDKTGIDYSTVNTVDEYHDMLTALAPYCSGGPFLLNADGQSLEFLSAWNITGTANNNGFMNVDGQIVYSPATEGFRDYLSTMAQWYEEGLIHIDFTNADDSARKGYMLTNECALYFGSFNTDYINSLASAEEAYDLSPLYNPVLEEGQIRHAPINPSYPNAVGGTVITVSCENPATLISWLDYWYCEEGFYLGNYGIEGESWAWKDGYDRPMYTDMVEYNPDGKSADLVAMDYITGLAHCKLYDWRKGYYESYGGNDTLNMSLNVRDGNFDNAYTLPQITLTAEEASDFAAVLADINTYVSEFRLKVITGVIDINAEWDTYLNALENFGLQDAIDAQQAALDRYNAR